MEQKPLHGQQPLDPPSAEVARLYLQEADIVERRRESHVDRRRVARLLLIDGVVLAVLCSVMLFGAGERSSATMLLLAPFFLWVQLEGQLRRTYGFQESGGRFDRNWRLLFLGIWLVMMAMVFGFGAAGVEIPLPLQFLPAVLCLLGFGWLGVRERRRARGVPSPARAVSPLSRSDRLATLAVGVALGMLVSVSAAPPAVIWGALMLTFIGSIVWTHAMESRAGAPRLGETWRRPQWTAFALGCAMLAASALLAARTDLLDLPTSIAGGAVVAAVMAVAALRGGRDG